MNKHLVFNRKLSDFPNLRCFRVTTTKRVALTTIRDMIRKHIIADDGVSFLVSRTVDTSGFYYSDDHQTIFSFYVMVDRDTWLSMLVMTIDEVRVNEVAIVPREHNDFRGKVYTQLNSGG